jgi:hypothetical protein
VDRDLEQHHSPAAVSSSGTRSCSSSSAPTNPFTVAWDRVGPGASTHKEDCGLRKAGNGERQSAFSATWRSSCFGWCPCRCQPTGLARGSYQSLGQKRHDKLAQCRSKPCVFGGGPFDGTKPGFCLTAAVSVGLAPASRGVQWAARSIASI